MQNPCTAQWEQAPGVRKYSGNEEVRRLCGKRHTARPGGVAFEQFSSLAMAVFGGWRRHEDSSDGTSERRSGGGGSCGQASAQNGCVSSRSPCENRVPRSLHSDAKPNGMMHCIPLRIFFLSERTFDSHHRSSLLLSTVHLRLDRCPPSRFPLLASRLWLCLCLCFSLLFLPLPLVLPFLPNSQPRPYSFSLLVLLSLFLLSWPTPSIRARIHSFVMPDLIHEVFSSAALDLQPSDTFVDIGSSIGNGAFLSRHTTARLIAQSLPLYTSVQSQKSL